MTQQQPTVSDIFRRAQAVRQEHSDWSYKQVKEQLVKDYSGSEFPPRARNRTGYFLAGGGSLLGGTRPFSRRYVTRLP